MAYTTFMGARDLRAKVLKPQQNISFFTHKPVPYGKVALLWPCFLRVNHEPYSCIVLSCKKWATNENYFTRSWVRRCFKEALPGKRYRDNETLWYLIFNWLLPQTFYQLETERPKRYLLGHQHPGPKIPWACNKTVNRYSQFSAADVSALVVAGVDLFPSFASQHWCVSGFFLLVFFLPFPSCNGSACLASLFALCLSSLSSSAVCVRLPRLLPPFFFAMFPSFGGGVGVLRPSSPFMRLPVVLIRPLPVCLVVCFVWGLFLMLLKVVAPSELRWVASLPWRCCGAVLGTSGPKWSIACKAKKI